MEVCFVPVEAFEINEDIIVFRAVDWKLKMDLSSWSEMDLSSCSFHGMVSHLLFKAREIFKNHRLMVTVLETAMGDVIFLNFPGCGCTMNGVPYIKNLKNA